MASDGEMDPSCCATGIRTLSRGVLFSLLVCFLPFANGQTLPGVNTPDPKQLCAEEKWKAAVEALQAVETRGPELQLCYGIGLAQLGQLDQSAEALSVGRRQWPDDKRFPMELAGVAFKKKQYPRASRHLRDALKLEATDTYANDFLGTVYFLQGNLPAALKYWNRVARPQIAEIRAAPVPKLDPVVLDRAFAFAPASVLRREDLATTEARLKALEIFPSFQFDLAPRTDSKFDLIFRHWERNGTGPNKKIALLMLLRGLPAQSVYPEYFNIGHSGLNLTSFYRWDKEKRRVTAEFSGPLLRNPKRHFRLGLDLRNENWDIRRSFDGPAPLLGGFNLRREAATGELSFVPNGRWQWSAGVELSHRDFRSVVLGPAVSTDLLLQGMQLKQQMQARVELLNVPERRLTLVAAAISEAGHIWSVPEHSFEKLEGSVLLRWFPVSSTDDYEVQHRFWGGGTVGSPPFDELFKLGTAGDNDLWLRGHIATRDGRKGIAPIGSAYFLSNWELDKTLFRPYFLTIKAGPLVDTGKMISPIGGLGTNEWLWDVGVQVKASVGNFGVALSYAKDLRSGNNAVNISFLR